MRKSSVHFKQVANASVSIAHSTRTEEKEPAYLLPKEHRLGNVIVPGSMSNIDLGLEFTRAKDSMTGQAKARGSSPFWEGVIVLDGTDLKAQTAALQSWKKEYEKATGQRVLHMAIHGDEGFINSAGKPEYNIHAHVIVNRLNDKGRVIKLERKQLSAVQDLTAKSLGMQRGETLEERKGMRGRKHLNHREFKAQANEKRLDAEHNIGAIQKSKAGAEKAEAEVVDLKAKLDGEPTRLAAALAAQEEKYRLDRKEMKESGTAKQADYQALKIASDAEIVRLKKELADALAEAAKVPALKAQLDGEPERRRVALEAEASAAGLDKPRTQQDYKNLSINAISIIKPLREKVETMTIKITQLEADKLEADKAKFADMAAEYQRGLAAGTPAHLIVPGEAPSPPTRGAKPGLSGEKAVTPSGLHGPRAIEQPQGPVVDVALATATTAQWDAALAAERVLYLKELTAEAHAKTVAGVAQHQAHLDSKPMLLGKDKWEATRQGFENRDTRNNLEWQNLKAGTYPFLSNDKEAVQKAVERRVSDKNPALAREVPKAVETLLEARRQDAALERGRLAQKLAEKATQQQLGLGKDKGVGR